MPQDPESSTDSASVASNHLTETNVPSFDPGIASSGNSVVQQATEPSPPTQSIVQAHLAPTAKKSYAKLIALLVLVLALCGTGGGAFAYYYFVVRIPDSAYQQASHSLDIMIASIKSVQDDSATWSLLHPSSSASMGMITTVSVRTVADMSPDDRADAVRKIDDAQKSIQNYGSTLAALRSSQAVVGDAVIKKAYGDASKKLEAYQSEFVIITDTAKVLGSIATTCEDINFDDVKDLDGYDAVTKDCIATMKAHPTVSLKDYNTKIYAPTVAVLKDFLTSYRDMFEAIETGDEAEYATAYAAAGDDYQTLRDIMDKTDSYHTNPPADPTGQLNDLKTALQNRQKVFWR